jgi:hypothetical protein
MISGAWSSWREGRLRVVWRKDAFYKNSEHVLFGQDESQFFS